MLTGADETKWAPLSLAALCVLNLRDDGLLDSSESYISNNWPVLFPMAIFIQPILICLASLKRPGSALFERVQQVFHGKYVVAEAVYGPHRRVSTPSAGTIAVTWLERISKLFMVPCKSMAVLVICHFCTSGSSWRYLLCGVSVKHPRRARMRPEGLEPRVTYAIYIKGPSSWPS